MTIVACSRCGAPVDDSNQYCARCGSKVSFPVPHFASTPPSYSYAATPQPHAVSRGFGQMFGLDPRIAFLTVIVDMMLFGGDVLSGGLLVFLSVFVGAGLGFVTYKAQMNGTGMTAMPR